MSSEINDLERLVALRDSGEINAEEFDALKAQLLAQESQKLPDAEEKKRLITMTVIVTLLVCGAAFGLYSSLSGSSNQLPPEEQAFVNQFVSTGAVSDFGGLGEVGFSSSDARCVGTNFVDRVGLAALNDRDDGWMMAEELPPELALPFFESMSDCVDLKELTAIGMAEGAEVDVALFDCALDDLSEGELVELLAAPMDELEIENGATARLLLPILGNIFDCAAQLPDFDLGELMELDW